MKNEDKKIEEEIKHNITVASSKISDYLKGRYSGVCTKTDLCNLVDERVNYDHTKYRYLFKGEIVDIVLSEMLKNKMVHIENTLVFLL